MALGDLIPYDFWFNNGPQEDVTCECLMPTGHVIALTVSQYNTFSELKEVSIIIPAEIKPCVKWILICFVFICFFPKGIVEFGATKVEFDRPVGVHVLCDQ